MTTLRERALLIGRSQSLVGIVSEPDRKSSRASLGFVFLNAGFIHRVGPNRLYVRLARALGEAGFPALRFDLSGLGDSDPRDDAMSYTESAPLETREALDQFARMSGIDRFVLVGICSGAQTAFHVAHLDSRVAGAVMVDPYAYPTTQFYLRYYLKRALSATSWRNTLMARNDLGRALMRLGGRLAGRPREPRSLEMTEVDEMDRIPSRAQTSQSIRHLLDRGARLFVIYSGIPSSYNYRGQFRDAFPELPDTKQLQVEYFPRADHTFTHLENQRVLIDTIRRWALTAFEPGSQSAGKEMPAPLDASA